MAAVKALGGFLFPAVVVALSVALALTAVAQARSEVVAAPAAECETAGIVPGSVAVVSTSTLAGAVSGHTIRFQLCPYPDRTAAAKDKVGPPVYPDSISLLWDKFYLHQPEEKGIVLTAPGAGKSWPAAAPYSSRLCYTTLQGEGVSVKFADGDGLNGLIPAADRNIPITLQFDLPETAGMINPLFPDPYPWRITPHYARGDYGYAHTAMVRMPIFAPPLGVAASISLSDSSGPPGTTVTVAGYGFPPLSPVESVLVDDWSDVAPDNPVATNAQGQFRLDITFPGLVGIVWHTLQVQVAGVSAATPIVIWRDYQEVDLAADAFQNLGDNLVRVFHFSHDYNKWYFYDPQVPEASTMDHLVKQKCYWLLVKEPAEVILGRKIRNLTCWPEGKCWNFIVW